MDIDGNDKLRVLDLFSGIGGFSLGLERTGGFETVAFCETDPLCRKVLKKHWPDVYIHDDIRTLGDNLWEKIAQNALLNQLCREVGGNTTCVKNAITNSIMEILKERNTKERFGSSPSKEDCQTIIKYYAITAIRQRRSADNALMSLIEKYNDVRTLDYDGPVDVITGGYPCQPFSGAGKRKGSEDDRHLWPAMFSLIKKHRPTWVIGENVAGHISLGLDDVLSDLGRENYTARTFVIPAASVGAYHKRNRVWIIAHSNSKRWDSLGKNKQNRLPDINLESVEQGRFYRPSDLSFRMGGAYRNPCSGKLRNDDGLPEGMDRLRALGNAVVPQIPEMIGRAILQTEYGNGH